MAVADRLKAVQIKANLIADERIGLMEIEADVHDGISTLTGYVTSEEEKQLAEQLAYQVEGIHEVVNEIQVLSISCQEMLICELTDAQLGYGVMERGADSTAFSLGLDENSVPPGPNLPTSEQFPGQFTDEQVEDEVRERLASQRWLDQANIEFKSINQLVYLKGKVKTNDELNRLQDLVLNARGVMGIAADVTVEEGNTGTPVE